MTLFPHNELRNAFLFSESGNQALLLCKKRPVGDQVAWLIDPDTDRLWLTAKRLGMARVRIVRGYEVGQHVVITGRPLDRAVAECAAMELAI